MNCQSCGMSIDSGTYCQHCVDEAGNLKAFEETFARFVQWSVRQDGLSQREAEAKTRAYMKTMPAWQNDPALS